MHVVSVTVNVVDYYYYLFKVGNKQTNKNNTKIPTNFSLGYYYLVQRVDMLVCTHVHWIYISYVTHTHFDIHFTIRYSFCVLVALSMHSLPVLLCQPDLLSVGNQVMHSISFQVASNKISLFD